MQLGAQRVQSILAKIDKTNTHEQEQALINEYLEWLHEDTTESELSLSPSQQ